MTMTGGPRRASEGLDFRRWLELSADASLFWFVSNQLELSTFQPMATFSRLLQSLSNSAWFAIIYRHPVYYDDSVEAGFGPQRDQSKRRGRGWVSDSTIENDAAGCSLKVFQKSVPVLFYQLPKQLSHPLQRRINPTREIPQ
jgi:hypothetical protein